MAVPQGSAAAASVTSAPPAHRALLGLSPRHHAAREARSRLQGRAPVCRVQLAATRAKAAQWYAFSAQLDPTAPKAPWRRHPVPEAPTAMLQALAAEMGALLALLAPSALLEQLRQRVAAGAPTPRRSGASSATPARKENTRALRARRRATTAMRASCAQRARWCKFRHRVTPARTSTRLWSCAWAARLAACARVARCRRGHATVAATVRPMCQSRLNALLAPTRTWRDRLHARRVC